VQSDLRNHAIVMETQLTDTGTYENAPAPTTSPDVTVSVPTATTDTYCIQGSHTNNAAEIWSLRPGAGLAQTAC
ncbi:MAG: hypothetical protein KY450_13150, partial [Actinobacteria bacterium]|nr:hypothetical protein [Actinomycetota bacterium]